MKLYIKKIANLFILFFCQFLNQINGLENDYVPSQKQIYTNEIRSDFVKYVHEEFDLVNIGLGGSMPDKIREISVSFQYDKNIDFEEARWLMIFLKEKLATMINAHEKIRPFLAEYPFPPSRADIELSYYDTTEKDVDFVFMAKNKIYYCKRRPEKFKDDFLFIESYEDALKKYDPNYKSKFLKKHL